MVAGGRLTASTRFCGVEEQGGKRWFVVRKGGPSSSVERRVPMLDIEEVCEVSAHEARARDGGAQDLLRRHTGKVGRSIGGVKPECVVYVCDHIVAYISATVRWAFS